MIRFGLGDVASVVCSGLLIVGVLTDFVRGECEQDKRVASDGASQDYFGWCVRVDGSRMVAGSPEDALSGPIVGAGSAYVFLQSGGSWSEEAKLTASDASANDTFGWAVSISGDYVVIGAKDADPDSITGAGAAYIFFRSSGSWSQQAKLVASDKAAGDGFGFSVSIMGDYVIVGAPFADPNSTSNAGKAYVFFRSGTSWSQQAILVASDKSADDNFGISVAALSDRTIVGAPKEDNTGGTDAGAAYIYLRSGTSWTQEQKLTASVGSAADEFGGAVAIDGDRSVVGAWGADPSSISGAGAAYVFSRSGTTWTQEATLVAESAGVGDAFGISVAIDDPKILVGAPLADLCILSGAGESHLFERSGTNWSQIGRLTGSDVDANDSNGNAVGLSGDVAVLGSPYHTESAANQGSVYVVDLTGLYPYGDIVRNDVVDVDDIYCVLDCFSGYGDCFDDYCARGDIHPCGGSGTGECDYDDITAVLDAFLGDFACAATCGWYGN